MLKLPRNRRPQPARSGDGWIPNAALVLTFAAVFGVAAAAQRGHFWLVILLLVVVGAGLLIPLFWPRRQPRSEACLAELNNSASTMRSPTGDS